MTLQFKKGVMSHAGNELGASTWERKTQSVEVLNFQAGVSYTPSNMDYLRFTLGYQYEHWFSLGRLGDSRVGRRSSPRNRVSSRLARALAPRLDEVSAKAAAGYTTTPCTW